MSKARGCGKAQSLVEDILSTMGREILTKSLAQAISRYIVGCFYLLVVFVIITYDEQVLVGTNHACCKENPFRGLESVVHV